MVQLEIVEDLLALRLAGIVLVLAKSPPHVVRAGGRHEGRSIGAGPCRVVDSLHDINIETDSRAPKMSVIGALNVVTNTIVQG